MKKSFILLTTLLGIGTALAQSTIFEKSNTNLIQTEIKSKSKKLDKKVDFVNFNKAKGFNTFGEATEASSSRNYSKNENATTPFASIDVKQWSFGTNLDTNESIFFSMDYKFKAGAFFTFKTYSDDFKVEKQFTISLPETANSVQVVPDFSSKIVSNNNKLIVPIYVHYFEGGQGPEFQKHEIWFVSETGEIIQKVTGSSAQIVKDVSNKLNIFVFEGNDDFYTATKVDLDNAANNKEHKVAFGLMNYFAGVPIAFKTFNGKDYLVFTRYSEVLMDNDTYQFNTNAKFVLDFIDFETFKVEKSYQLPVFGFDPEDPYTIPMITFGMFYNTDKYDISSDVYNSDSKMEFTYGINFYSMIQDTEWFNYYVVNEDGQILKKLDETIVNAGIEQNIAMQELPNQKDQVVMLLGSEEGISNIKVYNLPDLDLAMDFPALHNEDLLSLAVNRISKNNSINYLIGLTYGERENDDFYGLVKHYDSKGAEVAKVRLPVGNTTERFAPFMTEGTLNPHVVNSDDEIEYVYAYQDRIDNLAANTYRVAQSDNLLASFSGRTEKGNINSAGYLMNKKGELDRMFIYYGSDYSATSILTEFYKFPFETLGVNDITKNTQLIKYLSNVNQIRIDYDYSTYQVYNVNGTLVDTGKSVKTIYTNGWNKGVYFIKTIDKQGKANAAKVLVF